MFRKITKPTKLIAIALILFISFAANAQKGKTSVLVVRGGHPYDTPDFEKMCTSLKGVKVDLVLDAHFKSMKVDAIKQKYDAILFLNQNKYYNESKRTKQLYMDLTNEGVGMVFLHFTLSSQPSWDDYHDIIGGKWFLGSHTKDKSKVSTYFIDRTIDIKVKDTKHPIAEGVEDFTLTDTFYGNIWMSDKVKPILGVDDKDVNSAVVWENKYNNSKVIYIMPGFSKKAFENKNYKKVVANSLKYAGN
ncbi:ThuA domain-containing protein [Labilibacter marinus]|uniref:ThuA domain-containing protein n=1 Tax=Labilibacter marinus TaxID=1477105 RepID=UPI0008350018|nr:ThuA domain-containing protein [Labilibacter marinus]